MVPRGLTRRTFLALGGGAVAAAGLGGHPGAVAATRTAALTGGYPRVLGFRQSEWQVPLRSYEEWERIFAPFSGIVGKALQEERTDTTGPQTVEYFTRFKQQYPDKLVLLHLNGRARRPGFRTAGWSAGWWLHRVGSVLTAAADPADTVLQVASTTEFSLRADFAGGVGDDIVIAPSDSAGRPDFALAEQVRLSAMDRAANTLTVIRGRHGTTPGSFAAGAYVAPHVYAGPWSEIDDRVWLYNLSTMCPVDPSGRRLVEVLSEQIGSWFGPDGELAAFDGLQLDVFQLDERDRIDADCDGVADLGRRDGVDTYLQGQVQLTTGLRQRLGPGRYLLTDGGAGQQPDAATVNGVELECFPTRLDYDMTLWSQGLMTLQRWRSHGARPRLSYPLYKYPPPRDYPVSFNRFRLALAAALATNSVISWHDDIGGATRAVNDVVVWDELRAGTANVTGWLGAPRGDPVHLAEREPDRLGGAGTQWPASFVDTFVGPGVTFRVDATASPPTLVVSRRQATSSLAFTVPDLPLDGPDLVVALDLRAVRRPPHPATVGRQCTVAVTAAGGELAQTLTVPTTFFHAVLAFHGIGPGPVQLSVTIDGDGPLGLRGLRLFAAPDAVVRGFAGGAVFANPSGSAVTFDVAALFPGRQFTRLPGSAGQDPITNDGSLVGPTLTLPPLDALVVRAL